MSSDKSVKEGDSVPTPPGPVLQAGLEQPSAVEQITSKIEAEKQYSGADTLKMVQDALSADGREQKDRAERAEKEVTRLTGDVTTLATQYNTVAGQVTELVKAQNEAEVAKVGDDPVAITSIRVKQANAAEALRLGGVKADYDAKNTALTARETEALTKLTSVNIKLAAIAAGVDEKTLGDLVPDGDPGRLKKMAGILKQSSVVDPTKQNPDGSPKIDPTTNKPFALTTPPASAISAGGDDRSTSQALLDKAKGKK